jgi:hypothetical protein
MKEMMICTQKEITGAPVSGQQAEAEGRLSSMDVFSVISDYPKCKTRGRRCKKL